MVSQTSASSSMGTHPTESSVPFPRARVYWLTEKKKNSEPRDAWICVSTSVRWVFAKPNDLTPLEKFSKFRGHFCLSLERMQEHATWKDVEEKVKPIEGESGPAFFVLGKLSGREVPFFMDHSVQLVIITDSVETRNALMDAVRIRISPWQLLHKRMKEVLIDGKLSDQTLNALFACVEKSRRPVENREHETSGTFVNTVEESAPIIEGLNVLSGFAETVATVVKKSVPIAKDVAEEVADLAKCVTVVSSALQVVVICASLAEMGMEVKRAKGEWPHIHATVEDLRRAVVKSMIPILHPDGQVEELLVKNVFEVQQELVDVLVEVENEMMRGSGKIESLKRFWKARNLRTIESKLDRLKVCVLQVVHSSSIAGIRRDVKELKQSVHPPADTFKPCFDCPSLPPNLVFDFESFDEEGTHNTPEGILLNSVLHFGELDNSQGASALGTHGMGGVGKTTALKKICCAERVRSQFVDGVCFMQFGQDATMQKVREEICRCMRKFGGVQVAKDMKKVQNLGEVVNRAAEWLDNRAVLLVCDDLWARDDNVLGYVTDLKNLLRDAPKSGLLISTRDRTIARAVSSSLVSFECVEAQGSKAREILGRAAFGDDWKQITSNWEAELEYAEILEVCAGLPLALGIAGSAVNVDYLDSRNGEGRKDASFAVKNYVGGLKEGNMKTLRGANAEYHTDGLKYVVEASLKWCEAWGRSGRQNYRMERLFRSLCILEKQQFLPESTLKLYWRFEGLDDMEVREVVGKFADLNLMKRERLDKSVTRDGQFCARLHDLVLELCKQMAVDEKERWHIGLINAYRMVLEGDDVTEARAGAWWKVKDDGHFSGNLSRHLIASGCWTELEALLCDVRWTLRRYEMGGWAAIDLDFKRLFAHQCGSGKRGIRELHSMLKSCWGQLHLDKSLLGFYAFGYFSKEERRGRNVSEYLKSVEEHLPSPWLCPKKKCVFPADSREQSRWGFNGDIMDIAVSWSSERVVIAYSTGIEVWPLWRHKGLFRIPIDAEESATSVAISEDAEMIVSGHKDGGVRRWNAHTGEPVGEPMYNHTERVSSVAIRGNLIVSGSNDDLLYRYNVTTGEVIGNALEGHTDPVLSVAISANGKLIVSGSEDETIRRWDAGTGKAVGSPLRGHYRFVKSVATSSDGELIVSGSADGTVRRWRASTGEAIGEPLRGHDLCISSVAISEDEKYVVSGSIGGEICLWDASSGEAIGLPSRSYDSNVLAVAISGEGKLILSGHGDRTVRHWDISAQGNVSEGHQPLALLHEMPRIVCVTISACGEFAVSGSWDGVLQKWDTSTSEPVDPPMKSVAVECVEISKDGRLIVNAHCNWTVQRWDASTGESIGESMYGHSGPVDTLKISDDGKLIVTGSWDKTVRRWDARTGNAIGKPMVHCNLIEDVAISTDGSVIVSGCGDRTIVRWNAETGEKIGDPIKVAGLPGNLVISSNCAIIACGSVSDDFVQQWETATGEPIGERMKWSEGQHVLDEMRRARLCGEQECNAIVRKDTFPTETKFRAVCPDKKKVVLHLQYGNIVVCERR